MTRKQYKEARERAAHNRTVQRLAAMWKTVEALLQDGGPEASGHLAIVKEEREEGIVRTLEVKGRKTVRAGWHVPTLVLDATLQVDLVRPYYPQVELVVDVEAQAPHQRIVQTVGRTYSKSYFEEGKDDSHLKKLATTIGMTARRYAPERVLVVAQQDIEDWLKTNGNLPKNVELAHHNAVSGLDHWGPQPDDPGVAALIVIGRTIPSPDKVEALAEALTGVAIERLGGWYQKRQAARELAGGQMATAEVDYHPHQIAEAIRWDICEGQVVQIVGRPRGVNRVAENPVDIFILTDVVLPMPVDCLVPADELDPTPADRMMEAEGVALDNPTDASEVFNSFWKTPDAARKASQRGQRYGTKSYKGIYRTLSRTSAEGETEGGFFSCCETGGGFAVVEYQRQGGGKSISEAVVDLNRVPDPEGWLIAKFGELADYQLGEVTPSKPKRPPQPAPEPTPEPACEPASEPEPILAVLDVVQESSVFIPPDHESYPPAWAPSPPPTVLERMPWMMPFAGDD